MKKILKYIGVSLTAALSFTGCFDLDEQTYTEIPIDKFFKNEQELVATAGRAYTKLQAYCTEQSLWTLNLQVSDECAVPVNAAGEWTDERYGQLHRHTYNASNKLVNQGWNFCFDGIAACNEILYELNLSEIEFEGKGKILAEVEVLRALFYMLAIDGWGNVPFSIDYTDTSYPEQKDRAFMFNFIEKAILDNIEELDATASIENYGRVTQGVAWTILAKLYLNAETWINEPMWEEAADACQQVMNLGCYHIEQDYTLNFAVVNEASTENIFAIPYSTNYTESDHNAFILFILALDSWGADKFNISASVWDGFVCQPDFFESYAEKDLRRDQTWMYAGNQLPQMSDAPYNPVFDESLYSTGRGVQDGARIWKWNYQTDDLLLSDQTSMENDFAFFRYADVVLMYAEALVRQGRAADAANLADLQAIRTRAGLAPYTAADLTLDELLAERGRELAWEGWRRQDLIRFGKYDEAWWAKPSLGDPRRNLFPIPTTVRNANPNLAQNPGY